MEGSRKMRWEFRRVKGYNKVVKRLRMEKSLK
jgi:hypothetical protein